MNTKQKLISTPTKFGPYALTRLEWKEKQIVHDKIEILKKAFEEGVYRESSNFCSCVAP